MKKVIALFTSLILSFAVNAAQYKEGVHYRVLNTKASEQPTVTEYFSFYCSHCYKFEPMIRVVKKNLPEGAVFEKNHVSFMGRNMGAPMAKAYATMVLMKNESTMVPAMFEAVHLKRQAPENEQQLRQIFLNKGVDANKFDAVYQSFAADSMQKQFDRQFMQAELRGVPGIVVNNKYVLIADRKTIKTPEDYLALVEYLLKLT